MRIYCEHTCQQRWAALPVVYLVSTLGSYNSVLAQSEVGHYVQGVLNIRDYVMPDSGLYGLVYTYGYSSTQLADEKGETIDQIVLTNGNGNAATLDANVAVNIYVLSPTLLWVSNWKVLGARYGAYIAGSFGNTSIGAALASKTGSGRNTNSFQFGAGDLFVQPLWLGWNKKHLDFQVGYGFYAPVGKYITEHYSLPVIGTYKVEAADNIGLGFWTHQFQGGVAWYPLEDDALAIVSALTYEVSGNKKDFDIIPGDNLSLNWGLSQFLPLTKDKNLMLEIGPTGYSSWQVTNDTGDDAKEPPVSDQLHGAGAQLGLTNVEWAASLNFHYFYEFVAVDRFKGQAAGMNITFKF